MMDRTSVKTVVCLLLTLQLCVVQAVAAQSDWDIAALMEMLASSSTDQPSVRFREERVLAYLDSTLTTEGVMSIDAEGQLTKETLLPQYEHIVIVGDTLRVTRKGKQEVTLLLNDYPLLLGFIEAFRATLRGNLGALERHYRVEMEGAIESWLLRLHPLSSELGRVIEVIEIKGGHGVTKEFKVLERGGDHTTITISASS